MLLTADDARRMLRQLIEDRYESQAQAARQWQIPKQNLNDILQGRRPIPPLLLEKLGLEPVTMYEDATGKVAGDVLTRALPERLPDDILRYVMECTDLRGPNGARQIRAIYCFLRDAVLHPVKPRD
jgi:hypothetical protein